MILTLILNKYARPHGRAFSLTGFDILTTVQTGLPPRESDFDA